MLLLFELVNFTSIIFSDWLSFSVYYENLYLTQIREEREYTLAELIAEFGGLLGLLAGGSLLSIIELILMLVLHILQKLKIF